MNRTLNLHKSWLTPITALGLLTWTTASLVADTVISLDANDTGRIFEGVNVVSAVTSSHTSSDIYGQKQTLAASDSAVSFQHADIGVAQTPQKSFPDAPNKRALWFEKSGLGLFIHYGLPSVAEGMYDLSWSMVKGTGYDKRFEGKNKLTPNVYYALAKQFNPTQYNPDKWLKAAKEAGFKYAVFTTRHHDGFALWPSNFGDLSTKNYMGGRDLVGEYVAACRKNGIKVGFYYSPPDWYRERLYRSWGRGTPPLGMDHQPVDTLPPKPTDFDQTTAEYLNGQIRELLMQYGKVDYLWFDGSAKGILSQEEIRQLQPDIIMNDRQHGNGDVITSKYECQLPKERPNHLWEHPFCMTGNGAFWGYTKPLECLPSNVIPAKLVRAQAWGGNVLANFGPQANGEMPPEYYQCMREVKTWMSWAETAIHEVTAAPKPDPCTQPVTVNGNTWYVHLLPQTIDGPASSNEVTIAEKRKFKLVTWLKTGEPLNSVPDKDRLRIQVPEQLRTDWVDIIKIEWADE